MSLYTQLHGNAAHEPHTVVDKNRFIVKNVD